jgi:hypothetical protein
VRAATRAPEDPEYPPVARPTMEIGTAPPAGSPRILQVARRVTAADRLIGWGIVLLVLAAVTAGAISFTLGASATSK